MPSGPMILVVGSVNMDLVVRCPRMPVPGQTVLGDSFKTSPGGKGANQAVAVARLGGNCRMIGRVGADAFGQTLQANLKSEGVDCTDLLVSRDAPTGVAMIVVDAQGENSIVVASGANFQVTPDDLFEREEVFRQASIVVVQLELPLPTVRAAIDLARKYGRRTLLDPAPAFTPFPDELCDVDIISPNVSETELITGRKIAETGHDKLAASDLMARGARNVALKLGGRGSMVVEENGRFEVVPPYKVDVVDTTAAGDAFTAGLATALARGEPLARAARFANAVGALACTRFGAQSAMPTADDVAALMNSQSP